MPNAATDPAPSPVPAQPAVQAWRIEVYRHAGVDDPEGGHARAALVELGLEGIRDVRLGRGFLLPPTLERSAVERSIAELLADPVLDEVRIVAPGDLADVPVAQRAAHRVLVARRPGVMNPVALTLEGALRRTGILGPEQPGHVATFKVFEIEGSVETAALETAARRALGNDVIENIAVDAEALE